MSRDSLFPVVASSRRRIDRARLVIMQAYVEGVSTRSVDDLVQALEIDSRSPPRKRTSSSADRPEPAKFFCWKRSVTPRSGAAARPMILRLNVGSVDQPSALRRQHQPSDPQDHAQRPDLHRLRRTVAGHGRDRRSVLRRRRWRLRVTRHRPVIEPAPRRFRRTHAEDDCHCHRRRAPPPRPHRHIRWQLNPRHPAIRIWNSLISSLAL